MSDLISREWLEDAFDNLCCHNCKICRNFKIEDCSFYKCALIDNAPPVTPTVVNKNLTTERTTGEREFIEILAEYREDDYDTLPEYRGKPYYSIHYRENGEDFVGFSTYKLEVLSRFLRDYFMNCGADMRGKEE